MTTNGQLVDEGAIERLVEAGLNTVTVSLDGPREVHDEIRRTPSPRAGSRYDRAIRAIELIAASPLRAKVVTQIHQRNIDELDRMHSLVAGLGVDEWQLQIAVPAGRLLELRYEYLIEPEQIPTLLDDLAAFVAAGEVRVAVADNIGYYSRHEPALRGAQRGKATFFVGCMAGVRLVSVTPTGDVRGCHALPREFVAGNVRERPFAEIWADRSAFAYNTEWREDQLVGGCAGCEFRRVCRAGCTAMAYLVTGTVHDNPYCCQRV
jgi:radical SAM protein with 4Fe4S-binding SPASM domain